MLYRKEWVILLKTRQRYAFILCFIIFALLFLSGCGQISISKKSGVAGEYYSSGSHQTSDRHDPEVDHLSEVPESSAMSPEQTAEQERFIAFCDRVFGEEMASVPTLDLHYTLLHPETWGIASGDVSLGSWNLQDMIAAHAEQKTLKEELQQFDFSLLSKEQQILYDTLLETLNASLMGEGLELYEQPLAPTIGIQAQLPILLSEYSFQSLNDVETYLALLAQIDEYYDQILAFENQKAAAGLAPSDATIDQILMSCESYRIDPENNFLTEAFDARWDALSDALSDTYPGGLGPETREEFAAQHRTIIREHFIPAYENLIAGMTALKGRGIHEGGLCELANGNTYYEYLLKSGPGCSYSVKELKAALERQMEEDLTVISQLIAQDQSLDLANAAFSLSDPQEILSDLQAQMAKDFPACPECNYEIRYVPEYLESSLSPAFYLTAPVDDLNQNVIYINNGYSDSTEGLYTTLAHEGFPGHLYQTVYHRSHAIHPLAAVLSCSGANEGWATYVENYACTLDNGLSKEIGEYRARARSFSLCVHGILDIGINYEGWSKEQAKQFITSYFRVDDATVDELYQTMIDNPTNYLEYCGGYVELAEMRHEAENTLGERFSPMEFHRFVLDIGPVPFSVMRKYFAEWLSVLSSGQTDKN